MFGSEILEVAIGIIFIYILVSIICTAIREGIEAWLKTRAAYLEYGIRELLHDKSGNGISQSFFNHPLIYNLFSEKYQAGSFKRPGLFANGKNLPSYIPARNFALTLMDIAARGPETDVISSDPNAPIISLQTIRMNVANIRNPAVQRALLTAIDSAQGDLNKAQANIQAWYDSSMDRISGWYKRSTQWVLFWIGLTVAAGLNINTITIADYLYRNDSARALIVARAEKAVGDTAFVNQTFQEAKTGLDSLTIPIGWSKGWGAPRPKLASNGLAKWKDIDVWNDLFAPVLGILLTAFAAMLGAPFWFDLLNKVMVIRSTVKPHEKSPEEASEDRQPTSRATPAGDAPPQRFLNGPVIGEHPRPLVNIPNITDPESGIDGCSFHAHASPENDITTDEQLPIAEGGVA